MIRLFIALPLPAGVEEQLARIIGILKQKSDHVKFVPSENIHLTTKFLGNTDDKLVEKISQQIDAVASSFSTIDMLLDRIGGFPNLRRPRVIWINSSQATDELAKIAERVDQSMASLHFERESKPFRPHLTLGRVRRGKTIDQLAAYLETYQFEPIPLQLDRLTLFKSTLTPRGAVYEQLHESKLGPELRFE